MVVKGSASTAPLSGNVAPPSTTIVCPVMYAASADARNSIAFAMSSGSPIRASGMSRAICAATDASPRLPAAGVRIIPGSTPLTVTWRRASSSAAARMKPFTPAFDAA